MITTMKELAAGDKLARVTPDSTDRLVFSGIDIKMPDGEKRCLVFKEKGGDAFFCNILNGTFFKGCGEEKTAEGVVGGGEGEKADMECPSGQTEKTKEGKMGDGESGKMNARVEDADVKKMREREEFAVGDVVVTPLGLRLKVIINDKPGCGGCSDCFFHQPITGRNGGRKGLNCLDLKCHHYERADGKEVIFVKCNKEDDVKKMTLMKGMSALYEILERM